MPDHDQRFKLLLQTFPSEFFAAFLPAWSDAFDFSRLEWLETEAFPDPPQGERRSLDLVARLPLRKPAPRDSRSSPEATSSDDDDWLSLIHIEIDGGDSVVAFRPRMFDYYSYLRLRHRRPILPVAVFLNLGMDGLGVDSFSEFHGSLAVVVFQYLYVGLKALEAETYLSGDNPLPKALVGLMKCRRDARATTKVLAADAIRKLAPNEWQRYLLLDCLDAYLSLTPAETVQFEELMAAEPYQETKHVIQSIFDKAREEGRRQGRDDGLEEGREETLRAVVESLMTDRWGAVPASIQHRLRELSPSELQALVTRIWRVSSRAELGLGD